MLWVARVQNSFLCCSGQSKTSSFGLSGDYAQIRCYHSFVVKLFLDTSIQMNIALSSRLGIAKASFFFMILLFKNRWYNFFSQICLQKQFESDQSLFHTLFLVLNNTLSTFFTRHAQTCHMTSFVPQASIRSPLSQLVPNLASQRI